MECYDNVCTNEFSYVLVPDTYILLYVVGKKKNVVRMRLVLQQKNMSHLPPGATRAAVVLLSISTTETVCVVHY